MPKHEVALDLEHFQEEETVKRYDTTAEVVSRKRVPLMVVFRRLMLSPWWKTILTMSCVLSVSVDPLFLYIPITNEDMKCLRLDQNLKTVTLLLRSAVDLPCIVQIIFQILAARHQRRLQNILDARLGLRRRVKLVEHVLEMAKRILWSHLLIDILAILPIPQVVILIFLPRTRGSKSLSARKFLNSLVVFQYFPRLFRMYQSRKVNKEEADSKARYGDSGYQIWLRVYKFILASHVLGAFWYFFSIQREMDCWQYACRNENKCETNTFDCGGNHTFKNVTFLNDLCPISTPNPTLYNFGIFLDALQSGILGSTDFPQKFLHCFLWGLRSLSSFGQNLETSTYAWENLFALGITVAGLILFLIYLSAILQFANTIISERNKREMILKEVDLWLSRKGLPSHFKGLVTPTIDKKLKHNINVEVDNILSLLPSATRRIIERYLRLNMLKKVPLLQSMTFRQLKTISEHLERVEYDANSCVFQEGERLQKMIFIADGTVRTCRSGNGHFGSRLLERGDFYGSDELFNWASKSSSFEDLPISTRMVKAITKVEAFALSAEDLKSVAIKYWWAFTKNEDLLEQLAASVIQKQFRNRKLFYARTDGASDPTA